MSLMDIYYAEQRATRTGKPVRLDVPRADATVWVFAAMLMLVVAGGLGWGLWKVRQPALVQAPTEIRIGAERLLVPEEMKGPRAGGAREVGLTRLRLTWPELSPPRPGDKADVHITIGPADAQTDPRAQFQMLARFLSPGAWSNPGGLVARGFKRGSPFEADELYMSLPDGAEFFARCTADVGPSRIDEGCRTVIKHGPFDITLRFPREALTEWRALSDRAVQLIGTLHQPAS
jgi:hypothetical protein